MTPDQIPAHPERSTPMTDLRQRYAEALALWALMYPISAWALADGPRAVRLAENWGRVAAKSVMDVRDEHLQAWRERAEKAEAAIARARALADRWNHEPHPSHDHLCPDDIRRQLLTVLDDPQDAP